MSAKPGKRKRREDPQNDEDPGNLAEIIPLFYSVGPASTL